MTLVGALNVGGNSCPVQCECNKSTHSLHLVHARFDPLWNSLVVGGLDQTGKPFLGTIGMIGTAYSDQHVATGMASAVYANLQERRS